MSLLFNQDMLVDTDLNYTAAIEFYSIVGLNQIMTLGRFEEMGSSKRSLSTAGFTWTVVTHSSRELEILFSFEDESLVSSESKDTILVEIKDL